MELPLHEDATKKDLIFLLDDERLRYREYAEWLVSQGFDVAFFDRVDEAAEWLGSNIDLVDCFVVDCLMPYGETFSSQETDGGILTGLLVYRQIRRKGALQQPVLILTNSNDPRIREELADDPHAQVLQKSQVLLDELSQIVKEVLAEQRNE